MPMNIFITGATSGIGLELATLYSKEGHSVGICGRDLTKLPAEYPDAIKAYECDVLDRDALHEAVRRFSKDGLDIMVANAGISVGNKTPRPNFEISRCVIKTNVIGVLNAFEIALEYMLPRRRGHIVGISSVAGLVGLPGASAYCASKAAVLRLCESYSIDLKSEGIDVTCICPGFIDTPLTRQNAHPMPFLLSTRQGAQHVKKAIDHKKVLYIFPWQMKIVITFLEKIPKRLYRLLMKTSLFNPTKSRK